jgi:hypothetical protein
MKSTKLSTIMFSIIIVLAMMLSIQNNAFSENWRDGFARISMLPQGVSEHQCFTANGFVYCAGGSGFGDEVWFAKLNSEGYLEEWNETTPLPYEFSNHQCFTTNGFVYCVIGSYDRSQVWFASLNSDGSLGSWQTTSSPYSATKQQCFTVNGFVYCAGGYYSPKSISRVMYANLNPDGNIGNWEETTSLPYSISEHQCFAVNGFVYFAGGGYEFEKVWRSRHNIDGTLGDWQQISSLPYSVLNHQMITANGFIYCIGGSNSYYDINTIFYAKLNPDGSLGDWLESCELPYKLTSHQAFTSNGYIYSAGGYGNGRLIKDVIIYFNPFISIPTHPDKNTWYVSNQFTFQIADQVKTNFGFYYKIDDSEDSLVTASNSNYSTDRSITISSGIAISNGEHFLHLAIADNQYKPLGTTHFAFKTLSDPIQINSSTHPSQSEWYESQNLQIEITNAGPGLTYRYIIDDHSNTIPNSTSNLLNRPGYVFVNQQPGTHYLHIQVFDELGSTGKPIHFRYNIYDSDEPKPAPLPVVTELNVNPTSVTKDGTISIEGTIEIK